MFKMLKTAYAGRRGRRVKWGKDWEEKGKKQKKGRKNKASHTHPLRTHFYLLLPRTSFWKALLSGIHSLVDFRRPKSHANLYNIQCLKPSILVIDLTTQQLWQKREWGIKLMFWQELASLPLALPRETRSSEGLGITVTPSSPPCGPPPCGSLQSTHLTK